MRKFTTSLFIALLALLALPEKAWAWTSVEFRSSLDNWAIGHTMTKKSANSFSYEVTASEDFNFRFYVSDNNGLWLRSYETSSNTVSNYDGSVPYWCSNSGDTDITFKVDPNYTKYRIDLLWDNQRGDNHYFRYTVTGITEGGSSDPVSYALVGDFGSSIWKWNDSYVFKKTADNTYSLDIAGSTFSGKSFKLKYKEGTKEEWAAGPATDHLTITLGEAVSFNGDGGKNYVFPTLDNKDYVIELTTTAKTAGSFTVKEKTSAPETKYTVTISAGTGGSVNLSGAQQIGSTGVSVTATADEGYTFDKWETTGGAIVASKTSRTTTVTATSDGTLTAYFTEISNEPESNSEGVTLYVKNDAGWDVDMYAYVFKTGDENAQYPGEKMIPVRGNENYDFKYTVPDGFENGYVVFSAGTNRFPADKRSGFGIRNASHLYNNEYNTWTAPQASTIEGKNSVTIYAYINDDLAWYPANDGDSNGNIEIGTNFYIFAYTNAANSEYHAYDPSSDTKLTTNDYKPDYGKTAGTAFDDYGDYCDETVYPVGYSDNSNLRYAKFVIYYDKELEGQTAFYTLNSGSLGKGQTSSGENYQIRQLFKDGSNNLGDSHKGTPYYYELPSVQLENGTSYSFKLSFANNYMHQTANSRGINYENYRIENASSEYVAKDIFPTVTLDDDYGCTKGQDNSNGTFYKAATETEAAINIWDKASTYNVNMYRPFYSDGLYETICLPFDVPAKEVSEKFGTGTRLFKVTDASEASITFTEQTEANCYIEAGVPYIILPKLGNEYKWDACAENGKEISFAAKEMKFAYNAESKQKEIPYTDKDNQKQSLTMKGCFIPYVIGGADRFFNTTTDNQSVFYQQAYKDRRVIRGTRVFFNDTKDPEVTVSAPQATKRIVLKFDSDENEATGIYFPETGKVEIFTNPRIYTISGQYVGSSLENLAKGIYVVNGKKIVIR